MLAFMIIGRCAIYRNTEGQYTLKVVTASEEDYGCLLDSEVVGVFPTLDSAIRYYSLEFTQESTR